MIELRCLGFKLCLHLVDVCLKQGYVLIIEVCLIAHDIYFLLLDHFRLLIKFDLLFVLFKLSCCHCKILLRLGKQDEKLIVQELLSKSLRFILREIFAKSNYLILELCKLTCIEES